MISKAEYKAIKQEMIEERQKAFINEDKSERLSMTRAYYKGQASGLGRAIQMLDRFL